ncbi:phosphopantetheine-binding protein [Aurantiacibacter sp. MUD11]|uniref:phosphopantetheine-binding protein n=1 Tax=Aurantiacibacter sp. MUD11 TaxID=3003265 RepID=UPI0022AADFE4|nr:phosphopantetheine-binding protein [Aurantiacibacter sp. MUD11]WAT18950.1 phosphopantetheine-binding protein [Aurantiacibacter sp. MUD11]
MVTSVADAHLAQLKGFFEQLPSATGQEITVEGDTELLSSGLLDSLQLFMLVSYIEDEMGIAVDPDDITPGNFETLNDLGRLLSRYEER